jgi:cobalt-zinc-cadmium efflux system outer membrane protein
MLLLRNVGWLCAALLSLAGCTSVALNAGFDEVSATIEERSGVKLFWNNGTELNKEAAEGIATLLKGKLTAEQAVQIALLNNRDLQALYSDLGVAQADLVQAGLLRNPMFDAAVLFPLSDGGKPKLELSTVMNFLDIFYVPLRRRVVAARFDEAKLRVTGSVLDFAGRVRTVFYIHQANQQLLELRQTIVQALSASFEVARRLQEAGNITDLDFFRERALLESGKVQRRPDRR